MAISLPSSPAPNGGNPFLRDFGGVLAPFLGGPEQRINRIGTRFGIRVTMPPMKSGDDGRLFVSRLLQARQDRLLMAWPLNGLAPGSPGAPKVSAVTAGGSVLPLKGLTGGYTIREGQFLSIIHGGRRYIHMATANATASGGGTCTATIFPMLRSPVSVDDVVEIAQPMIEGHVLPGDEMGWEIAIGGFTSIQFSVAEAA